MLFVASVVFHEIFLVDIDNTPLGMFFYHGTASIVDYFLLVCTSYILQGKLSQDIQLLCAASMCANFFGWIAYLCYVAPIYYDSSIWLLNAIQLIWLFSGGSYDAHHMGVPMVHRNNSRSH